jgi:hypothetical protein
MGLVVQIIEKDIAVGQTKNEQVAACRHSGIKIIEKFKNILFKLAYSGHPIK